MTTEQLLNDLEEIVNRGLEDSAIPHARGNSIRIKHVIIRKSSKGYLIYDSKENKQVVRTYFKTTAVAIAKNLAQGNDITETAIGFDDLMLKHYNDAIFYRNSIRNTTDAGKREIREVRLDLAIRESQRVRSLLDRYIFC
jgi:hypothetical protein|tara:strand:+ start:113 stop:532 length:420 start_codon:yes stop_codon:yes gene_type:complete